MTEMIHVNHFNTIRDNIKPGDGWSSDDWDYALVDAAVRYLQSHDFEEYYILKAVTKIGGHQVYATQIGDKFGWHLDKEQATQFKINRAGKTSPIQDFLDKFKPIECFVTDMVLEKYHVWMVKDMYIDEI